MNEKKEKMFRIGTMIGSILLSVIVTIVSALKFKSDGNIGEGNISLVTDRNIVIVRLLYLYDYRIDFFGVLFYFLYDTKETRR